MESRARYKLHKGDGAAMIIINKNRLLLLKRLNIPFISNPGIWSFVFGGRKKGERYIDVAYREVLEETGLSKKNLTLIFGPKKIYMFDRRRLAKWYNFLFVFKSNTSKIKLDFENSKYRWVKFDEILKEKNYTNIFLDADAVNKIIKRCLNRL